MLSAIRTEWIEKQCLMSKDFGISPYRLSIWAAEETYVKAFGRGYTLNLGAGDSPIPADVSCDPLIKRNVVCVGEALPFQPVFDTVLIFSVLDHVIDDRQVLIEASRVLKRNGRILVMQSVWGWRNWVCYIRHLIRERRFIRDPYHMRNWRSDKSLMKTLRKAGFRILDYRVQYISGSRVAFVMLENSNAGCITAL